MQSNNKMIENRIKQNSRYKAVSINAFDISTWYTNIPHNKLKNVIGEIINFEF